MPSKPTSTKASTKRSFVAADRGPHPLSITLNTTPEMDTQLRQLQREFAAVCNAIAPIVQETRCWNRVALHHLVYHDLRGRFPQLGSQLICNAIYSVSRHCRTIFQSPGSPFNLARLGSRALPKMRFAPEAPVYFDRHTLSIRNGIVSMLTLDGRIRFRLAISEADEQRFRKERLREIILFRENDRYQLQFVFAPPASTRVTTPRQGAPKREPLEKTKLPEFVVLSGADTAELARELGEVA